MTWFGQIGKRGARKGSQAASEQAWERTQDSIRALDQAEVEFKVRLDEIEARVEGVTFRLGAFSLTKIDERTAKVDKRQAGFSGRLVALNEQQDALRELYLEFNKRLNGLHTGFDKRQVEFDKQLDAFRGAINKQRVEFGKMQDGVNRRLDKLEGGKPRMEAFANKVEERLSSLNERLVLINKCLAECGEQQAKSDGECDARLNELEIAAKGQIASDVTFGQRLCDLKVRVENFETLKGNLATLDKMLKSMSTALIDYHNQR